MANRIPLTDRDIARFKAKIIDTGSCWEWSGGHFAHGYTLFTRAYDDGKWRPTTGHRVSYEAFVGPIPDGLHIDHLCRNRGCVNPLHLEAVTQAENNRRGISPPAMQARQTHCKNGHPFDTENTRLRRGKRECIPCTIAYSREYERTRRKRPA